ncbi:Alpha/Beta hydrolase protein [Clohesyomyces aquaticus]|uniref:Alpha/Beta hydrolase protein n=1 Tax=Clohesyomyces aquaticus TaxID=1231657 RepID=A0A1Y1YK94_9PLEO|nr:Alpha/Beta hydrolase protein [Clohesyomyces aquaticus]
MSTTTAISSSAKPKPTLIFVHGAWHQPSTWNKLTPLLCAQDYTCIKISLPSTQGSNTATLGDDIAAVRSSISNETSAGRDVIVIAHSYGGAVGQSAIKGFTRPNDSPSESHGHVLGLILISSGFGITGQSFIGGLGGVPPPTWSAAPTGYAELTNIIPSAELFYHDLPADEAEYWVSQLTKQSLKALMEGGEDSYSGWKDCKTWILLSVEDKAFPVEAQRALVGWARGEGAKVEVRELASSHSAMLSQPEKVAEFVVEAVDDFVGEK